MEDKIKIALKIIDEINGLDINYLPKIGGSLALYHYGVCETVNDIDIIVNTINDLKLPYEIREISHKERLNGTVSYMVDGVKVDIIQSIMPRKYNGEFEDLDNIIYSKKIINNFINIHYK